MECCYWVLGEISDCVTGIRSAKSDKETFGPWEFDPRCQWNVLVPAVSVQIDHQKTTGFGDRFTNSNISQLWVRNSGRFNPNPTKDLGS